MIDLVSVGWGSVPLSLLLGNCFWTYPNLASTNFSDFEKIYPTCTKSGTGNLFPWIFYCLHSSSPYAMASCIDIQYKKKFEYNHYAFAINVYWQWLKAALAVTVLLVSLAVQWASSIDLQMWRCSCVGSAGWFVETRLVPCFDLMEYCPAEKFLFSVVCATCMYVGE